jgi:hypothetical protein
VLCNVSDCSCSSCILSVSSWKSLYISTVLIGVNSSTFILYYFSFYTASNPLKSYCSPCTMNVYTHYN